MNQDSNIKQNSTQPGTEENMPKLPRRPQAPMTIDVKDMIHIVLSHWYWFIISVAVALGLAVLYLMRTPEVYHATTSIMILNSDADKSSVDLSSLGIRTKGTNVNNEILFLESPALLKEVVSRLGLNNSYYTKMKLRLYDLYNESPVIVTPAETMANDYVRFDIALDGHKNFVLSGFADAPDTVVKGSLGQTVNTPAGKFTIAASPTYNDSPYKDSQIIYVHTSVDHATSRCRGQIWAHSDDDNSSVITIYNADVSPQRAHDMLEALVTVYGEQTIKDLTQGATSTTEFIDTRLEELSNDLSDVDSDISSYKSSTKIPDVETSSSLYYGKTFENQSQLLSVNSQIEMAQLVRRELENESIESVLPVNTGIEATGIQSQITEYNKLVLERNRLLASGTESNPVISETTKTISVIKDNLVRSLENYIRTLKSQLSNIETTDSKASSELSANPERAKALLSVERQQKVKEELYMFLLQKREESKLSQAYIKPTFTVLSPATIPGAPNTPQKANILLIALAIGFAVPLAILFLRESLNTTVRNRRDLNLNATPFIGEIPYGPGKLHKVSIFNRPRSATAKDLVVKEGANNVINEAFRAIRTSLEFMTPDNHGEGRIISLTSACSGSGKTFIVMNLAKALSLSGKRVLVVDLDMRKASLSKWGERTDRGISNYLIGQADMNEIIMHNVDGNEGVDLIPVGILPPNPVELLSHARLKELFEHLRHEYDYVLVDCPPAEIVADARIISRDVDMTLFIVRAGMFEKGMIPDLEEYATTNRYHNLAVILNGTDPNSMYRRKRYGYGYGYGYGYVKK